MRQTAIIILLFIAFLISCQGQNNNRPVITTSENQLKKDTNFIPSDSTQFYFPTKSMRDTSLKLGLDSFVNTWYSKHLFAMREPLIYGSNSQNEVYRFTWLRTFHNPIAIRIEKHGDTYSLYWKLCSGAGGYKPGKLVINKQKTIDKVTWDKFKQEITQIDFWNLNPNESTFGEDGAQWILEGKDERKYYFIERWTPDRESKYYRCCDFLIRLTDLNIRSGDKY